VGDARCFCPTTCFFRGSPNADLVPRLSHASSVSALAGHWPRPPLAEEAPKWTPPCVVTIRGFCDGRFFRPSIDPEIFRGRGENKIFFGFPFHHPVHTPRGTNSLELACCFLDGRRGAGEKPPPPPPVGPRPPRWGGVVRGIPGAVNYRYAVTPRGMTLKDQPRRRDQARIFMAKTVNPRNAEPSGGPGCGPPGNGTFHSPPCSKGFFL